jgi:hypothetical protein
MRHIVVGMSSAESEQTQPAQSVTEPRPRTTPPVQATGEPHEDVKSATENVRVIGGLLALAAGLVALVIIVLVAIGELGKEQAGAATTAGITAVATMVGAYFGVKVGSDGTKEAIKGQKEEAAKAQAFALAADPDKLKVIQALLPGEAARAAGAGAPEEPPRSPTV